MVIANKLCILISAAIVEEIDSFRFHTANTGQRRSPSFPYLEVKPASAPFMEGYRMEMTISSLKDCPGSKEKCYDVMDDKGACIFLQEYQGYNNVEEGEDTKDCTMRAANNFLGRVAYDAEKYDKWLELLYNNRQDVVDILRAFNGELNQLTDIVEEIIIGEGTQSWDYFKQHVQNMHFEEFVTKWWLPPKFEPNNEYQTLAAYMMVSFAPSEDGSGLWFMPVSMNNMPNVEGGQACKTSRTKRIFAGDIRGHSYAVRYCDKTARWQKLDSMAWRRNATKEGGDFSTVRENVQPNINVAKILEDTHPVGKLVQWGEGFPLAKYATLKNSSEAELFMAAGFSTDDELDCYPEEEEDIDYDFALSDS